MAILPAPRPPRGYRRVPACTVVRTPGATPLLRLRGELDRDAAPSVEAVLRSALSGDHPSRLRIDVGDVSFVDVEGVRVLARTHRAAVTRGAEVVLVRPRPFLLELARHVAPDLLDAARDAGDLRVVGP